MSVCVCVGVKIRSEKWEDVGGGGVSECVCVGVKIKSEKWEDERGGSEN